MATPFVQGRLRETALSVEIRTVCAHCGSAMQLVVDSEMHYQVRTAGAGPLVFEPHVDWTRFTDPNIIHAY